VTACAQASNSVLALVIARALIGIGVAGSLSLPRERIALADGWFDALYARSHAAA
jgi:hypothetical protein